MCIVLFVAFAVLSMMGLRDLERVLVKGWFDSIVGFKENRLYLLPLEVKTGARPDYNYAGQQAAELKRYLQQDILEPHTLASQLYRALFIRQVLMQVEKLQLYGVLDSDKLAPLLDRREWWYEDR